MRATSLLPLAALLRCAPILASSPGSPPGSPSGSPPAGLEGLMLSGFLVGSILDGEGEQCVRVANTASEPADVGGFQVSNRYGPGAQRFLVFAPGTEIPAGAEIVVARDAAAYRQQHGEAPDFELGKDLLNPANDPEVLDVAGRGWPLQVDNYEGGVLALLAPDGKTVIDAVAWDLEKETYLNGLLARLRRYERKLGLPAGSLWQGEPLNPVGNLGSPFGPRSRVFVRDHHPGWQFLPNTHSARDWDAAASSQHLGEESTHRVMMAGQSRFQPKPHAERARLVLASAPDNNHQALLDAWSLAEHEILVSVYYFSSLYLMDALLEAMDRGVDVTLWMEGGTVGVADGFSDLERHIAQQIEQAGRERSGEPGRGLGRVYWLAADSAHQIADRYAFDHSKYSIVDGRIAVIGSENYGLTGHAVDPSYGNRGWEVQVHTLPGEAPLQIVRDLLAVWHDDVDPEHHQDVVRYHDDPATLDPRTGRGRYGPPPRGFDPREFRAVKSGRYWSPFPAKAPEVEDEVNMQLVLSPDNSLNEGDSMLGAVAGAQQEILVNHLDLPLNWGSRRIKDLAFSPETTPNLLLEALVAAARRGVRLRVLLDCSGLGCESGNYNKELDGNDDTIRYLRHLAEVDHLDIQARYIDIFSTEDLEEDWQHIDDEEDLGLDKIHNKGLIIDRRTVLFSSINGSENSFKGNREVGLLVTQPRVAAHYATLFYYDWTTIDAPRQVQALPGALPLVSCDGPDVRSLLLTGLPPDTPVFVRVTSFDSDPSDVDRLDYFTPVSPHESAFSAEVQAASSPEGKLGVCWEANHSEDLEGDLAGYRVYWSPRSTAAARTIEDARRLGLVGAGGLVGTETGGESQQVTGSN